MVVSPTHASEEPNFFSRLPKRNVGYALSPRRSNFFELSALSLRYIYSFFELCLSRFDRT